MKRTPQEWEELYRWLDRQAHELIGSQPEEYAPGILPMLNDPQVPVRSHWWDGFAGATATEDQLLELASRALARGEPLPALTPPQRARLSLRWRCCARIARALSSRHESPLAGWFGQRLSAMPEPAALEWLLVDGWKIAGECFDEALLWADQVPPTPVAAPAPPPAPPDSSPSANATGWN